MPVERRGQAIRVRIVLVNWRQEEPKGRGGGRQLLRNGTSRVNREVYARFCERLGAKFPGPTRPKVEAGRACATEAKAFSFTPPLQGECGQHGMEEQRVTSGGLAGSPVAPEEVTL